MEFLKKLNAPMKALGGLVFGLVGKIFDKTNPEGLSAVQSSTFEDSIAADVANDETSFAGALSGTAFIITGWAVFIFALLGFVLARKMPTKKRRYTRRKSTGRKMTRKRVYRKKK